MAKKLLIKFQSDGDLFVKESEIRIEADTFHKLYMDLIRICYLTPFIEKMVPVGALALYNLVGFTGLNFYHKRPKRPVMDIGSMQEYFERGCQVWGVFL
jgi:hypothetical protein